MYSKNQKYQKCHVRIFFQVIYPSASGVGSFVLYARWHDITDKKRFRNFFISLEAGSQYLLHSGIDRKGRPYELWKRAEISSTSGDPCLDEQQVPHNVRNITKIFPNISYFHGNMLCWTEGENTREKKSHTRCLRKLKISR